MLVKPNFFIVGAPKSGTTAMNDFLAQHPEVFMAPKEILFFGSDLHNTTSKIPEHEYLQLFQSNESKKIIGESSVWYLFSKNAPQEIKKFSPEAKILIMLRNPLEMVYSMHSQNLYDLNEDEPDFYKAMLLEPSRKEGKNIPETNTLTEAIFYTEIAKYIEPIQRYWNIFGKENVHIILYDDFKSNTSKAFRDLAMFLGIDPTFQPDFKTVNSNKIIKNRKLFTFLKSPGFIQKKIVKTLLPSTKLRTLIRKKLLKQTIVVSGRTAMDMDCKKYLIDTYENDLKELRTLLDRDLSHWLT